jgi:hypothetical protein
MGRQLLIPFLWLITLSTGAQQSNMLFFMHDLPESNFINPAVQGGCGVFVGLPVISSLHLHASNSGFTLNQLLNKQSNGTYAVDAENVLNRMGPRNLLTTELYTTWLALGVQRNDWYFTFAIQEKDNLALAYPRDLVAFGLKGNTQFEGEWLDLRGTGAYFNHMREFALGVSKVKSRSLTVGMKAKLLFGKLNMTTGRSRIGMFTADNTFDLLFDVDAGFRSSMPYSLIQDSGTRYRIGNLYGGTVSSVLFSRRNPGLAFDFGFIYRYNDRLTLSGSLLDLGGIYYRSDLTNYSITEQYLYQGPAMDSAISESFFWDVFDGLNENLNFTLGHESYLYLLEPRLYLGADIQVNPKVNAQVLLYNRILPNKLQTSVTAMLSAQVGKSTRAAVSLSYMNRSFTNLGVGISTGNKPLQAYLVSDNILGFFIPMDTKTANIRFGLNLRIGCRQQTDITTDCGCAWYRDAEKREARKENLRRKFGRGKEL